MTAAREQKASAVTTAPPRAPPRLGRSVGNAFSLLPEISLAGNCSKELAPAARDAAIDVAADTDGSDDLLEADVDDVVVIVVVGDDIDDDEDF